LEASDDLVLGGVLIVGGVGELFDRVCKGGGTLDGLVSAEAYE
jgi:hypothetical protein